MNHYNLPDANTKAEMVVLANGTFPKHPTPFSILNNSKHIVCCDGATNKLISQTERIPNAIVGDLDSLTEENRIRFSSIVYKIEEQETNDLTKSVKYCVNKGFKHIVILGATGEREDHTIGNISLLSEYIDIQNLSIQLITDYGVFTAINKDSSFDSFEGQQVSIFQIENFPLTTENLKYPIKNQVLTNWWQGTLNESEKESFSIRTKRKLIIFRAFQSNQY